MHHERPVKMRLEGFPDDVATTIERLTGAGALDVLDQSRAYPNRRNPARVRVYLEVDPRPHPDDDH